MNSIKFTIFLLIGVFTFAAGYGQADATTDTGKEGEGGSAAVGMNVSQGVTLYQIADKGITV